MKSARSWPLSRKILGLAMLNVLLMVAILALFADLQFGLSLESLVLGPAQDRILAIANAFGRDLDVTPYASRQELEADYSRRYGASFYLVNPTGESLAGNESVALPDAVLQQMRNGGPGRGANGRGPVRGPGRPGPPEFEAEPPPEGRGFAPRQGEPSERSFAAVTRDPLSFWVGVRMPTNGPDGERGVPGVLLLRSDSIFNSRLFFDWRWPIMLAAALAGTILLCWWPFVRGVTRSIRRMDLATEQIAHGRFDQHVVEQRGDELGHLGRQINRMAGRLETFVTSQKRFLGDIAHELSAPIARIQFALGILEQKLEQKAEDSQQTHVEVLRDEIQEMAELVNELLMFSKAGMQPASAPLMPVDLAAVVQRAVAHQVLGGGKIHTVVAPDLRVLAHEAYLLRALSNLLRNALRYAGADGPIVAEARQEAGRVLLSVTDCGPGLPPASLDRIFEPFYRPEEARSRDSGGFGLGLAIVKSCIEACGGSVTCRNRQPSGLEVTISLAAATDRERGGIAHV